MLSHPRRLNDATPIVRLFLSFKKSFSSSKSFFATIALAISAFVIFLCCAGLLKLGVLDLKVSNNHVMQSIQIAPVEVR